MTKSNIILAIAASALTVTSFIGSAEANGVRLGFGGPMASFVATPTHGGGGGYSKRASNPYAKSAKCHDKAAPSRTARVQRSEPKVAHQEPKRKVTVASVERNSAPKHITKVSETVETKTDEVAAVNETPVVASGSKSLAQVDATQQSAEVKTDAAPAAETTTVATNETATEAPAADAKALTASEEVGCKKFIPAVGVTVTVDCEK